MSSLTEVCRNRREESTRKHSSRYNCWIETLAMTRPFRTVNSVSTIAGRPQATLFEKQRKFSATPWAGARRVTRSCVAFPRYCVQPFLLTGRERHHFLKTRGCNDVESVHATQLSGTAEVGLVNYVTQVSESIFRSRSNSACSVAYTGPPQSFIHSWKCCSNRLTMSGDEAATSFDSSVRS